MSIIEVNNVVKEFRLGQFTNLRQSLARGIARLRSNPMPVRAQFKALDDVSFRVQEGEVLGIIGTNGAGKSTMLKLLARISVPTHGTVKVQGKIAPLIEVGAGLIADLSGRENVYLNGIILGMSYREIQRKLDEIVAFAELEEFIDTPIKRYSSGMSVRLGFSIATTVDADILIVDEVLAVGDLAFQRKCFDRIEDMIKRQGKTVLLVSHNTRQVERLCSRVILLDHGKIIADGNPTKVCDTFYERSDEKIQRSSRSRTSSKWANTQLSDDLEVIDIALVDEDGCATQKVQHKRNLSIRIRFKVNKDLRQAAFTIGVHTTDFLYLTTHGTEPLDIPSLAPGAYEVECVVRHPPLLPGVYGLRVGITESAAMRTVFYGENLLHFIVTTNPQEPLSAANRHGFFALDATWMTPRSFEITERDVPLAHDASLRNAG